MTCRDHSGLAHPRRSAIWRVLRPPCLNRRTWRLRRAMSFETRHFRTAGVAPDVAALLSWHAGAWGG